MRGDVQIDFNTNDLRIEKSSSNVYAESSWRYESVTDEVILSIIVPKSFSDNLNSSTAKSIFEFASRNVEEIEATYNASLVSIEYVYVDGNGLLVAISPSSLVNEVLGENVFVDADDGTFSSGIEGNWNLTVLAYNPSTAPNQAGGTITNSVFGYNGANSGAIYTNTGLLPAKTDVGLFASSTEIDVVSGNTYEIEAYVTCEEGNYDSLLYAAKLFFLPSGYNSSECDILEYSVGHASPFPTGGTPSLSNWHKTTTRFIAKETGTIDLIFSMRSSIAISGTGGTFFVDDISLKSVSKVDKILFDAVEYATSDEVTRLTVERFNEIINEVGSEKNDMFSVYGASQSVTDVTTNNDFVAINKLLMGDFVVDDYIPHNEYILLNANEGSFLQTPLQGVGIAKYTQSPSSNQQLIDNVVEKFALDFLRVVDISKDVDNLIIESEDYNTKNGNI
jgi:hypothetical protein